MMNGFLAKFCEKQRFCETNPISRKLLKLSDKQLYMTFWVVFFVHSSASALRRRACGVGEAAKNPGERLSGGFLISEL